MNETIDKATGEVFELTPYEPGTVPPATMDELRHAYRVARDFATAYGDAVKAQAEKAQIKPRALRRYIAALEDDKLDEAAKEASDLERLIEEGA